MTSSRALLRPGRAPPLDPAGGQLAPISPDVPLSAKRIEVLLHHQLMIAYERDGPVFMSRAATGARFSSGNYETEPGRYLINRKRPSRHMAAGDRAAPNSYDLPGVPWVCYFTEEGSRSTARTGTMISASPAATAVLTSLSVGQMGLPVEPAARSRRRAFRVRNIRHGRRRPMRPRLAGTMGPMLPNL